jgi:hypothetical protein
MEICRRQGPKAAGFHEKSCAEVQNTIDWVSQSKHGQVSLEAHLAEIEKQRVSELLLINIPFLGIHFDINDLGAFSGIGLAIICFTLCFAMARQHENLYLSLWKVRRIADREGRYNDGESTANFLYHALAMAQVFTRPPTLARWRPRGIGRIAMRVLLFLPVLIQGLIIFRNIRSIESAWRLNPRATILSMAIQVPMLIVILVCILASCFYSRAGDLRWRETFFAINPGLLSLKGSPLLEWLKISEPPHWIFALDNSGCIYLGDPPETFVKREGAWTVWRIRDDGFVRRICDPSELPDEIRRRLDLKGNEYRFQEAEENSKTTVLVRIEPNGNTTRLAGGKRSITDGQGVEAGFSSIRSAALSSQGVLYAIDGACVRRIGSDGAVTTLGGNPLGKFPRSRWPRLLGLAIDGNHVLVADYDYGCIRQIGCEDDVLGIHWRSRGSWSPVGVLVTGDMVYVLEHRRPRIGGIFLGSIAAIARIQRVPKAGGSPTVVLEITS